MLWLKIVNDMTGAVGKDMGPANYRIEAGVNGEILEFGRVEGFERSKGWRELLLQAALELNNMEEPDYMGAPQDLSLEGNRND